MQIIDGKLIASRSKESTRVEVRKLLDRGILPFLRVYVVGEDEAGASYRISKEKACSEVGIEIQTVVLGKSVSTEKLLSLIKLSNENANVHGILVQLPLPAHIDTERVLESIDKEKDIDGILAETMGNLFMNKTTFTPCTPLGVLRCLEEAYGAERGGLDLTGKTVAVVGRSNIVGKPIAQIMLNLNATVIMCHSKTFNIKEFTKQADILIVAVGQPRLVNSSWLKAGAVVIDVGIHRGEDGKLCGDVDTEGCFGIVGSITPVPGGVGAVTTAMLLENVVTACKLQNQ